jgi:hypothetical protein
VAVLERHGEIMESAETRAEGGSMRIINKEKESLLSVERLREMFNYDPETGVFTRRIRTHNRNQIGDIPGCLRPGGYRYISIAQRHYAEHRLAWLYVTGRWPDYFIDHIDGNPLNNRFANLREASHAQNGHNRAVRRDCACGVKGVTQYKGSGKWIGRVQLNGKKVNTKCFDTMEEAQVAAEELRAKLHGEFANHGKHASEQTAAAR